MTGAWLSSRAWLPALLLGAFAVAFGERALGGGMLVFDDHPGQLYRLHHAITIGVAPWRFDPGWWAGYAELQYYPPGFAWLGAALHAGALGALSPTAIYQALLWVAWLLPGAATYVLLRRVLGDPWLAVPGAFVALTLSAGCRSGVEEGMRWGLVAARLGWGCLPLLAWSLLRWAHGAALPPLAAAALIAAVTLLHPAHAPTAAALVLLAAACREPRPRRLRNAALLLGLGVGLAAIWLLPLLAHLRMALPLAWQDPSIGALGRRLVTQPIVIALALLTAVAWRLRPPGGPDTRWLVALAPVMAGLVALDALVVEPLGVVWLPADRLMDGLYWALVLGGALGVGALARSWRRPNMIPALLALVVCLPLSWGSYEPGLSLWPGARQWPKETQVVRGLRMDALWEAIRTAPPGRVLFVRSAVPLDWRPEWWRAHTHLTALTPIQTGRGMLGGTFTHPSPVAGLLYTGSAANRPLTRLAEQLDGESLFGRPLDSLDAETFNRLAARLGVSVLVALHEDAARSAFLNQNPALGHPTRIGPFTLIPLAGSHGEPEPTGTQRWRVPVAEPARSGWAPLSIAYSPLWTARVAGAPVPIRRDDLGLLEVAVPAGVTSVELEHRPGAVEWVGTALSLLSAALLVAAGVGRARA
ncbi:MAG TPA: hypothetical protein VL086_19755 [Candidatus Nitrosotalea sp.]|nr:hypothetical protein [Candidatus Nitrosotalea sp.]